MAQPSPQSPTSAEIEQHILDAQKRFPQFVSVRDVIRTLEGRPIYAVTITDTAVADADKQNVLITAGQHGDEETGRLIALATLDWLLSDEGAETRAKQKIVILPNVNPDGCERDMHVTPSGVSPTADHGVCGPKMPEGKAVEIVARELEPEAYLDLHSRGYAGCSHDMVLFPYIRPYTEDDWLCHRIAAEMAEAAEASGIPQITHPLTWPGWGENRIDHVHTTWFPYREFKTLVMLTENSESNEHSYPEANRRASGLEKVKTFLAWGNRRFAKLFYPGYPCYLTSGFFRSGIVAIGTTAQARRASRIGMWRNLDKLKRLSCKAPEALMEKSIEMEYAGDELPAGIGIQLQVMGGLEVESITSGERRLMQSQTDGWYSWQTANSTFIVIAMPKFRPGKYEFQLKLKGQPRP